MAEKAKVIMKSRIDTIQTKEPIGNRELTNVDVIGAKCKTDSDNGIINTIWNPNNVRFAYSTEYKLSQTKKSMEELFKLVTVIDADSVKMDRVDIATDIDADFIGNVKLFDLLHNCLIHNFKGGEEWENRTKRDKKISNLRFINRDFNIEFYDKNKHTQGKHLYGSRLEVRLLRVKSQKLEFHIEKVVDIWSATPNNLEKVENIEIKSLCELWDEEKREQPKLKFTAFVYKYSHYFYTMNILKGVYKYAGLKGSLKGWLRDFRKTYKLEIYTKSDVEKLVKSIVKSLKEYKKL